MTSNVPLIRIVDDDELFRVSQTMLLTTRGWEVAGYASGEDFLKDADIRRPGCILLDVRMDGVTGMQVHRELVERGCTLPVIFVTGHGDIPMAVRAMQRGAVSFLEKPVRPFDFLDVVQKAVDASLEAIGRQEETEKSRAVFESLTAREKQIVRLAALDTPNKVIARELGIAEPTVKMHRANAFAKLGVKSPLEAYRCLEHLGVELEAKGETAKE
jgi:DNA-binding response regulator, luxR family